jgi:pimeloyl-ACP methyl ester carboxylesterase
MRVVTPTIALALLAACRAVPESGETVPRTGWIPVGDSFLHFEGRGRGPVLVFLHGGQTDARMWAPQVAAFPDYRVITFDARGFGLSGDVAQAYAAHDDLRALVESLHLPPLTLVGLSLGGRVAIDYALDHPENVERLVLAAPGVTGWDWSGEDHAFFDEIAAAAEEGDEERAVELWLDCPYMAPALEREASAALVRRLARDNARAWSIPPVEVRRRPPALECLRELTMPTLLIVGDRDVPDILRIADRLERELPDVRRVDIAGVGHMVNLEAPERFNAALRDFLEETGGRSVR